MNGMKPWNLLDTNITRHKLALHLYFFLVKKIKSPPDGIEPPTFRLTAERSTN